jgi:phosphomevalonate kinase
LDDLAESQNIVYKPCGAGGGDIGIVCSVDASELEEFASLVRSIGYRTVPLNVDPNGLKIRSIQE